MEFAIIGLGRMGGSIALHALEIGHQVHGVIHKHRKPDLEKKGVRFHSSSLELVRSLPKPRRIFLYIPAGSAVDEAIDDLSLHLEEGDLVIDGGNSYWGDSRKRHDRLLEKGIGFIDLGTSGGVDGARNGACFMAGGSEENFNLISPLLEGLAAPGAFARVGEAGTGHLVKLIHNGIEFGMLQAIGEGQALLKKFQNSLSFDLEKTLEVYRHGSVIRSWLIDLMASELKKDGPFEKVSPFIEDTGEVNWLVTDALRLEVPIPVISQSVIELLRSRDKEQVDYRSVALMRHGFGGHPFGASQSVAQERRTGRVDESFPFRKGDTGH